MTLTSDDLRGVYSFVPTPWDEGGDLATDILRHDLEYLCGTDVHGIYTPDSAAEFYELEFETFRRLVDVVLDTVGDAKPVQISCHWTNAAGAVRRAEYASERGADAIRITVPYWESLTLDEAIRFLQRVDEASGSVPLVYYATPKTDLAMDAAAYRRVAEAVPGLVGTKLDYHDPVRVTEVVDGVPGLAHFVSEYVFAQGLAAGASGVYSWLSTTNPGLAVEWYEACADGDLARAMEIQTAVVRWSLQRLDRWGFSSTAARTKLDARVNPNFECPLRVREPYDGGTEADLEWGRQWLAENDPELLPE